MEDEVNEDVTARVDWMEAVAEADMEVAWAKRSFAVGMVGDVGFVEHFVADCQREGMDVDHGGVEEPLKALRLLEEASDLSELMYQEME